MVTVRTTHRRARLHRWWRAVLPHLAALGGVIAAVGLTWLLWPVMDRNPLLFFLLAVAVSSWYGGLRLGLTATIASVAALYAILLDAAQGLILDGYDASRLGLFALVCLLLGWFGERRHAAERATRQRDETFAELFESASEAIVIVDEQGSITRVNSAAERMFDYPRDELLGQSIEVLVPPSARQRHVEHRTHYLASPRNRPMGQGMDLRAVRRDGSEFPVEISLSHVREGRRIRVMSFITDVTARKEAEASLARYQEQLRQLAFESLRTEQRERRRIAVELHDRIGQSLALCQIKLGGLRAQMEATEQTTEETMDQAAVKHLDDAIGLVQQSVDDTRSLTFELSPPVLYDLGLKAALQWLADQMRAEHRFEVAVEAADPPPLEEELASLLFRSVRELLINAVKHARTDRATVRLRPTGQGLEITVSDEGVGFDVEAVTRNEAAEARFGLLSIREQIEGLGGMVTIDASPGRGTRVTLGVPCVGPSTESSAVPPRSATEQASASDGDARASG